LSDERAKIRTAAQWTAVLACDLDVVLSNEDHGLDEDALHEGVLR